MKEIDRLDELRPIADEMLGGLHAAPDGFRRVREAALARAPRRKPARALVPALCCAALAVACVGALGLQRRQQGVVPIATITAGGGNAAVTVIDDAKLYAALGEGAKVRAAVAPGHTLFAAGEGDMPLVSTDEGVYRMLVSPASLEQSQIGEAVGEVAQVTEEPSLAGEEALDAGLSNVAEAGSAIYAVAGLDSRTAVAARVHGAMRLFQRVSYAGKGPGACTLEDTFSVRGHVEELTLSGVGTLTGEAAQGAIDVLLSSATLVSADASQRAQTLTATLDSGLQLQLGVSGDTLCGCGSWSCPEFFEAFEAAL